ncbi:hypothetical protein EV360DRAFT_40561 [Lentinula raphanica]|nr:hypothetical protein EV360DRAFT_40561 [Lentinula raphanica]
MAQHEIIDLTLPSSHSPYALSLDEDLHIIPQLKKRKLSRSRNHNKSTKKSRSESPLDDSELFLFDSNPSDELRPKVSPLSEKDTPKGTLLLPAHVSVVGSVPVEIIAPDLEDQDYVEYLDYGDRDELEIPRYFQVESNKPKAPSVNICKRCGAKGEHKTKECSVIICLTCGVRNEHSTYSCPISKVCFVCGMKGHLSGSCPNRGKHANTYDDCDRCGSSSHATNECPTHWRIYQYVPDAARISIMQARQAKKSRPLGAGGEGYIAEDSWCYNCGECGHWGDDCEVTGHVHDIPDDTSAFGNANLCVGPFSEIETGKSDRALQEWELDAPEWNDWGGRVPTNVGRQAKKKEMARMRATFVEEDDEDSFIGLAKLTRDGSRKNVGKSPKPPSQPKKMRFELNVKGAANKAPPSLLNRITDANTKGPGRPKDDGLGGHHRSHSSGRDREKHGYHDRDRPKEERNSKRTKDRGREERGPRYKGGYSNGFR